MVIQLRHLNPSLCSHYKGAPSKDAQPIAFVGKGITFDSGGISLKPSAVGAESRLLVAFVANRAVTGHEADAG